LFTFSLLKETSHSPSEEPEEEDQEQEGGQGQGRRESPTIPINHVLNPTDNCETTFTKMFTHAEHAQKND
jgi:hypothetical protein